MTNYSGTLYIGVTNNLARRVLEHQEGLLDGFTKKYKCNQLVYYEFYQDIKQAIYREKEIKKWRREKKINLILSFNPEFEDLVNTIV